MSIATRTKTATRKWVYRHLICEFDHWDICLKGLVDRDGERLLCRVVDAYARVVRYTLHPIAWDAVCDEYMGDYRVAYKHWCHENGTRPYSYGGWPLDWFAEKWQHKNPIEERAA